MAAGRKRFHKFRGAAYKHLQKLVLEHGAAQVIANVSMILGETAEMYERSTLPSDHAVAEELSAQAVDAIYCAQELGKLPDQG